MTSYAELPITGYLDRLSVRPGGTLTVHVSLREPGPYRAHLVRVISADPNPDGPGMRIENLSDRFDRQLTGRHQPIRRGSYALVPQAPRRDAGAPCTWTALVWPTLLAVAPQAVLAEVDVAGARLELAVAAGGALATVTTADGARPVAVAAPLRARRWYRLWVSADPATGALAVGQVPLDPATGADRPAVAGATLPGLRPPAGSGSLVIAAAGGDAPSRHFNGRIEDPAILAAWRDDWASPLESAGPMLAQWDFSRGIDTQAIADAGPQGCHGRLVNLPLRAVRGARWTGAEMCWRHAPQHYGAIHFHDDDLGDCGWRADFTFAAPDDLASGAYALHLTGAGGEDWLPFYVLPPRRGPRPPIAVLAPTFTYQAYANHARGNADAAYRARVAAWGAYPHNPDDYPAYGRSTYNRHADGDGIAVSTQLRPMLTMRPGFLTFNDAKGSGLRHYPADSHLLAWLDAKAVDVDIVTDHDLDDEGPALLEPYRLVLTGSHPEYHTAGTLDALAAHVRRGGRLAYLGGNGFYWRIARSAAAPGAIELRRAEGGIRAWAAEPGEYVHAFDGQYGGLWRRNGRPPQALAAVGFSAQGLFEAGWYRRLPVSHDPRWAWLFEGIDGDVLGDYGLSAGGAAGFELDRADPALGTPEGAVILARSEGIPDGFVTVPEELLSHLATVTGEPPRDLIRGEIVLAETAGGGAIFAAGSITFCGSLWRPGRPGGFDGPVSRLLENVVRRFASAGPL